MKENLKTLKDTVRTTSSITGFNYAFTRVLIEELKQMLKSDSVFVQGNREARKAANKNQDIGKTKVAELIITNLVKQVSWMGRGIEEMGPEDLHIFIVSIEQFLALFVTEEFENAGG